MRARLIKPPLIFACLVAVASVACTAPQTEPVPLVPPTITGHTSERELIPTADDSIQIGDQLEIFVAEDTTLNGVYPVREKGDVIMPRLGRVKVEGLSVSKAEVTIRSLLEKSQLRSASVIVDRVQRAPLPPAAGAEALGPETAPKMLAYLTGHVSRPGQHWITLPRGEPVGIYEAVLISGGLARFANDRKVEVLRKDEGGNTKRLMLDLKAVREGDAPDPPLYEGDIIFVPEKRVGL